MSAALFLKQLANIYRGWFRPESMPGSSMPFMVTEVSANLVGMRCNEGGASLNIIKPTATIGVNWKAKGSRKYRESFLHETSEKQGTALRFGLEGR